MVMAGGLVADEHCAKLGRRALLKARPELSSKLVRNRRRKLLLLHSHLPVFPVALVRCVLNEVADEA
jgi:hypothetical protein